MCRFARTAFLAYVDSKPHLLRRLHELSRQDIADYLGLTIETVSRTLTKLARDTVIVNVPDGVRLLGKERLDQIAAA
jgi:CRP/FNR family transcriptional regulator